MVYYFATDNSAVTQVVDTLESGLQWGTTAGTIIFATMIALTVGAYFLSKI